MIFRRVAGRPDLPRLDRAAGKRLIEHQQAGAADQLNPLIVTMRQRVQASSRPAGQAQALQPGVHAAGHVLRAAPNDSARTASRAGYR